MDYVPHTSPEINSCIYVRIYSSMTYSEKLKKFNWENIQKYYDEPHGVLDTRDHFLIPNNILTLARHLNLFKTRSTVLHLSKIKDDRKLKIAVNGSLKYALVRAGKPYVCESCNQGPYWQGKFLTLQLHHRDGNRSNNHDDNLAFLCPNCHSQTPNYAGRKRRIYAQSETSVARKLEKLLQRREKLSSQPSWLERTLEREPGLQTGTSREDCSLAVVPLGNSTSANPVS